VADFEIRASRNLQALAKRLKDTDRSLRNQLLRHVRVAAQAAIPDVQQAARDTLPRGGGLADRVASQAYRVQASYAGRSGARVRIAGVGMKELRDIDAGRVRHPVYGNRSVWRAQSVAPGFFSRTIANRAPEIRAEIGRAVEDAAHTITEGL
jgi:hypothetical protein